ncbi:hypothetical protein IMZ48_09455, partial [Candidatus Bathyarchaeota archaeon]|nr:hypothetical protein [Candidatus Bathyarchaeota archaeon]
MDIWERAQTFPTKYIEKFRQQLKETAASMYHPGSSVPPARAHDARPGIVKTNGSLTTYVAASTTPPGSPPPGLPGSVQKPAQPINIMDVLANIAKQAGPPAGASATPPVPFNTSTPAAPAPVPSYGGAPATLPYQQPQQPFSAPAAPPSMPAGLPGFPAQFLAGLNAPGANGAPGGYPSAMPQAPPAAPPAPSPAPPGAAGANINQVMLIKTLIDQGLQPDQISAILQSMSAPPQGPPQGAPAYPAAPSQPQNGGW